MMNHGLTQHYRIAEVAKITGLSVATIRKKICRREIGYCKSSRAVLIPELEVSKLIGRFVPAVEGGK